MSNDIFIKRDGQIAYLTLNRPARKNALNSAMWRAIPELLNDVEADKDIKVLIVHGGDSGDFAAGADISEFGGIKTKDASAAYGRAVFSGMQALGNFPKPTIAMISGACIGGGCGIALACDLRFADDTATFGITPAKLGLAYGLYDTKRLVDAVGVAKAKDILFTGRLFPAAEALTMGLIDRQFESDALHEQTITYVQSICNASQFTTRASKKIIQMIVDGETSDTDETRALFAQAFHNEDFKEGSKAFMEKRKPKFTYS